MRTPRTAPVLAVAVLALTGCTASAGRGAPSAPTAASTRTTASPSGPSGPSVTPSATGTPGCPTTYAAPDPKRPVVDLAFTVAADHTTVTGTEVVRFTPDLDVTELVFRLTANTAPTVAAGNGITVTSATADHGAGAATFESAGAAATSQGGLLHLPFADPVRAGTTVTARLAFTVTLGPASFDRFGRQDGFAWFGSAQPLLAWERGFGWHTEPMIAFTAESATSEAMDTTLSVTAPAADVVILSGDATEATGPTPPTAPGGSTRTWTASLTAARDVSVAAGPFQVSDTTVDVDGRPVRLRVGAPTTDLVAALVPEFDRALTELAARFGPFPFPSLAVARLPSHGGGIEYPGSILMLDGSRRVVVHETAHQWFYAMVGDSQALHAWLDEAFASYAEQSVDGDPPPPATLTRLTEPVDKPTAAWGDDEGGYYATTYDKGSAALFAARSSSGPPGEAAFDAAIRCYVAANAWRITNPRDLAAALSGLPAAIATLQAAGALPT